MNRLADETSPYLLQHAHNPVDWFPWGDEALDKARDEDKPIFLSVGYSACHWCHVMERESFESEAIAEFLNEHFVSVKVDREERPDIDNIYMEAVQVMTGQGGWPMTVFLHPETLEPFFAGTYFPPENRYGRPGFSTMLEQLHEVWKNDRDKVDEVGAQVKERLELMSEVEGGESLSDEAIKAAFHHFDEQFDEEHAGFGSKPKFPPSMTLRFLLHVWSSDRFANDAAERALEMVEKTLVHMASGGMYDQVGGGFHRYSTDREWLVPHFEKMLYDNGLLLAAYTEAYQATGREFYARIARETVEYLMREMRYDHDSGQPFYSAADADSEGEEGKFFVWTIREVISVLGADRGQRFCDYYGIREAGNFEGKSIPNRLREVVADWQSAFEELPEDIEEMRRELYDVRWRRPQPATDTKILASWNGLVIGALARAGAVFGNDDWRDAAASAARFVFDQMVDADGRLFRTYKDERARFHAYLDDYANMACACLDLFEARAELEWLDRAKTLVSRMHEDFWDADSNAFFYTADYHDHLLVRQREGYDGATPSSNSKAVEALLRLAAVTGDTDWRDDAEEVLKTYFTQMQRMPRSLVEMLQSLDWHLEGPSEIVLRTPNGESSLAREVWQSYLPNAVILNVPEADEAWPKSIPLLEGKDVLDGRPTVYECEEGVCQAPRHDW